MADVSIVAVPELTPAIKNDLSTEAGVLAKLLKDGNNGFDQEKDSFMQGRLMQEVQQAWQKLPNRAQLEQSNLTANVYLTNAKMLLIEDVRQLAPDCVLDTPQGPIYDKWKINSKQFVDYVNTDAKNDPTHRQYTDQNGKAKNPAGLEGWVKQSIPAQDYQKFVQYFNDNTKNIAFKFAIQTSSNQVILIDR